MFQSRTDRAVNTINKKYGNQDCKGYGDFRAVLARKDIDAVVISTPDHWHVPLVMAALAAGKDVFCEKPTLTIAEGRELVEAVKKHDKVFQTGLEDRSVIQYHMICEAVRNGAIGELKHIEIELPAHTKVYKEQKQPAPKELDWNMWLGPAQVRPYNSTLSPRGNHGNFPHWRNYKEFGGGMVTDWGAHHLDIAQWGLGMDGNGPVEALPPSKNGDKRGARLVYKNGVPVIHGGSTPSPGQRRNRARLRYAMVSPQEPSR